MSDRTARCWLRGRFSSEGQDDKAGNGQRHLRGARRRRATRVAALRKARRRGARGDAARRRGVRGVSERRQSQRKVKGSVARRRSVRRAKERRGNFPHVWNAPAKNSRRCQPSHVPIRQDRVAKIAPSRLTSRVMRPSHRNHHVSADVLELGCSKSLPSRSSFVYSDHRCETECVRSPAIGGARAHARAPKPFLFLIGTGGR